MAQRTFTVDVDYVVDHESLKAGHIVDGTRRVEVQATWDGEAMMIAEQIVACTHGIPTASYLIL